MQPCNLCVIHYEGTTDEAQPVPPSAGMDRDPSATLESSTVLLPQELVDEDTSRVTYAAPRDSVEQGVHLSPEEDTAKAVVSVAIFLKDANFIMKICNCHLEADGDNAINLVPNADTIFPDRVYLKRWNFGRIQIKQMLDRVKEELESVKCTRSNSAGNFAVTQTTNDVPPTRRREA